jgi:hypothetical protein
MNQTVAFECPKVKRQHLSDELRNFLRARSFAYQHISADSRRLRQLRGIATVLAILQAA